MMKWLICVLFMGHDFDMSKGMHCMVLYYSYVRDTDLYYWCNRCKKYRKIW